VRLSLQGVLVKVPIGKVSFCRMYCEIIPLKLPPVSCPGVLLRLRGADEPDQPPAGRQRRLWKR